MPLAEKVQVVAQNSCAKLKQLNSQTIFVLLVIASIIVGIGLGCGLNPAINAHSVVLDEKQQLFLDFPGI